MSSPAVPTTTKCDKKKTLCCSCECELDLDHPGIQCLQGHHYCVECSTLIVNLFFSEPQNYIPLRCVQCHLELNPGVFERQLSAEQLSFYHQHMLALVWAKELVGENERLDSCPFCSFAVIRGIHDAHILYCEHPDCSKVSCIICRKSCPRITDEFCSDEELEEMEKHFTCARLADDKQTFEQYLELGQKVPCPRCGLAGMKDDACTHMTCPTCSQLWCYFCGKKAEECDQEEADGNGIFAHNIDWENNPNRCPMYFTLISDIDDRWAEDDDTCLARFHRNRSLRLLREVCTKLGKQRIDELDQHFNILGACGFPLHEIESEDLTLINREGNESTLC